MAASVKSSGTQTAVIGTEHTLLATADAGTYQLKVDLVNMAAADQVILRVKVKVLTAGTIRTIWSGAYEEAAPTDGMVAVSIPLLCPFGATFTLQQVAGTGRNFDWSVDQP